MPSLIRPNITKVVTKEGEIMVNIAIELTLNLNADGLQVGVGGVVAQDATESKKKIDEDDDVDWAIPDFKGSLKFGKDTKD